MLPTKFRYIWPNDFRGEESKKSTNQKQESPVVAMFVNGSGWIEQSLIFIEDNLAKQFQRRIFLEIDQSETRIAYDGHVC
jgi:hypothetical protein